jgi:hypothetical protein
MFRHRVLIQVFLFPSLLRMIISPRMQLSLSLAWSYPLSMADVRPPHHPSPLSTHTSLVHLTEVSSSSQSALHSDFPSNPDEEYQQLEDRILRSMQYSRYIAHLLLDLMKCVPITCSRSLVFREVAAGKVHQDPLVNEISEEMILPKEINVKIESTNETTTNLKNLTRSSLDLSQLSQTSIPREKTDQRSTPPSHSPQVRQPFIRASPSGDGIPKHPSQAKPPIEKSSKGKIEDSEQTVTNNTTLFNLSPADQIDSKSNLDDFIYEENPFNSNFHSISASKRLKTVHFEDPTHGSDTSPKTPSFPRDSPLPNPLSSLNPVKPIEKTFFSAFDKLQSSNLSGEMDPSLSISPSILSLLEDDSEAW